MYYFQNTRTLHTLSLSGNFLQAGSKSNAGGGIKLLLEKLPNLESVDLSNCHLVQVAKSTFEMNPRVKRVNVSDNYLISLDVGVFNHLIWLESLDLSSNYFMDLPRDFFDAVRKKDRLKHVYLQVNDLYRPKLHVRSNFTISSFDFAEKSVRLRPLSRGTPPRMAGYEPPVLGLLLAKIKPSLLEMLNAKSGKNMFTWYNRHGAKD